MLEGHPDQKFAGYILRVIREGFQIGFDASPQLTQVQWQEHAVNSGKARGGIQVPAGGRSTGSGVSVNIEGCGGSAGSHQPLWGNPPKHKPNKWRLILDLSSPEGNRVNDGIARELASLSYVSVG